MAYSSNPDHDDAARGLPSSWLKSTGTRLKDGMSWQAKVARSWFAILARSRTFIAVHIL